MRADLHIHSNCSKDCNLEIKDIVKKSLQKKLDIISITDHDTIKGGLEADRFVRDNKIKLKIILGVEIKTDHGEIVAYNIKEEIKERKLDTVLKILKEKKAIISIPHPFDFFRKNKLDRKAFNHIINNIDFIEINSRSFPFINKRTREFARKHKLKLVGGSDAHFLKEIGNVYTIMDEQFNVEKVVGNGSYLNFIELAKTKLKKLFGI